jgi:E3 ubiquitin-protein ligase RNF115/126
MGHSRETNPCLYLSKYSAFCTERQANHRPRLMEALHAEIGATRGTRGAPSAFSMLSAILNMRSGDAVYSQEELDRVISQLIENNGSTGTAAPPASENAIRSLPKKKVDKEMIGVEGNAECSICMDNVELGTEVTVLPCTHWFHYDCIEAWLKQHNTCPHCRRSITANVA